MKVVVACIGRPGALLREAIAEYERRAARYWSLEIVEAREAKARKGVAVAEIRREEGERLLERVPSGLERVALIRAGEPRSSTGLAEYLETLAVRGSPGAAFLIGGAYGLSAELVARAERTFSLGGVTLPHDVARLVLAEQLYRAGTIVRGEPYHKGEG